MLFPSLPRIILNVLGAERPLRPASAPARLATNALEEEAVIMQKMVEHGYHKSVERRRGAKAVTAICSNSASMAALILQIITKVEMTMPTGCANVPMRGVMDAAATMIGELIRQQRIQTQSAKRT